MGGRRDGCGDTGALDQVVPGDDIADHIYGAIGYASREVMLTTKRVAILAASLKHGGFCYAGKELATGIWIRPVSAAEGHAISAYYSMVGRGDRAKVGDVLAMSVGASAAHS